MPPSLFSSSSNKPKDQKKRGFQRFRISIFGGKSSSKNTAAPSSELVPPRPLSVTPIPATTTQANAPVPSQYIAPTEEAGTTSQQLSTVDNLDSRDIVAQVIVESTEGEEIEVSGQLGPLGQTTSISLFQGANNMMFNQPNFYDQATHNVAHQTVNKQVHKPTFITQFTQNIDSLGTVLLILDHKRIAGTDLHSSARDPPPRCHPETRKELRDKLKAWLEDDQHRRTFLIWLAGPVGAGKTAVAQTFAEYCLDLGRLGAAFFFSGMNQRGRHEGLIPTIAHQLAVQDADYNRLITRILADDSSILDKTLEIQFRKLISEPFENLTPPQKPLVIVIDGLDECYEKRAQRDLIWIIGKYVSSERAKRYPLLWLVCSRPELHIQAAFTQATPRSGYTVEDMTSRWYLKEASGEVDQRIDYNREDITCDAEQDINDVYIILKDGLEGIRRDLMARHPSRSQKPWPRESQLQELSHSVCGLPVLAATVIRFIGNGRNPQKQLDTCLICLRDLKARTSANPLEGLDIFYKAIMERVDSSSLATAKLIISFLVILSNEKRWPEKINTALDVRIFLGLDGFDFDNAVQDLHSVLKIPPFEEAHEQPIQFFHKSFGEYLQSPSRAGKFALNLVEARLEVARHAIRIYKEVIHSYCGIRTECNIPYDESLGAPASTDDNFDDMDWYDQDQLVPNAQLRRFVRTNFWNMLYVEGAERGDVIKLLRDFEFCHLPFVPGIKEEEEGLPRFMSWMSTAMDSPEVNTILRLKPTSEIDHALYKQCEWEPPLRKRFPKRIGEKYQYTYSFISSHRPERDNCTVPDTTKMAFWIGEGERAALGLLDGSRREVDSEDEEEIA